MVRDKYILRMEIRVDRGQSLFEVVAAVAVVGIVLVALISLAVKATGDTTFSKSKSEASRHTQEALEWMRSERDANWQVFVARDTAGTGTKYCLKGLNWSSQGVCDLMNDRIPNTVFVREAIITKDSLDPNVVEVDIVTQWEDGTGVHSSRAPTKFTNWKGL